MKKHFAPSITLFLNLIIVLTTVSGAVAQSPPGNERVFPTGFSVRGEFLDFFERHGEIQVFGYPLTIEFEEDGRLVQYFHRGKLELHPENPPEQRVMLGLLDADLLISEPPIAEPELQPDSQFFPETGHTVTCAFLRYFQTWGGSALFGYPTTEMMVENRRIVQYFQRARLEWHPDSLPNLKVRPGKLGEIYLDKNNILPGVGVRKPPADSRVDQESLQVVSLDVNAEVSYPYAGQNQPQILYVFVYAQYDTATPTAPAMGATVRAVIHFPDEDLEIVLPKTNELGLSWQVFEVGQISDGETVFIDIIVSYGGREETTKTSFLVWL